MDITLWGFVALAAATALVGFSKTAITGANTISLAVFAAVLPARASTGVLLPILITGDVLAVLTYRRHAHWPTLIRLFPAVVAGVVAGTGFLLWADDAVMRMSIGGILLLMAAVTLWRRRAAKSGRNGAPGADDARGADGSAVAAVAAEGGGTGGAGGQGVPGVPVASRRGRVVAGSYGVFGGFTTMVANAGGPVMSLYLLSAGFRKLGFLGTAAWFFFIVNLTKVPFSVGLGIIDGHSLLLDAQLFLFVIPGALIGKVCVARINQRVFEYLVLAATVVGGVDLLVH